MGPGPCVTVAGPDCGSGNDLLHGAAQHAACETQSCLDAAAFSQSCSCLPARRFLDTNFLTGTLPATWSSNSSSWPNLSTLCAVFALLASC